jgi:chemotaxis protein CheD
MNEQSCREIYLQPGESQLVSEPAMIRTILGSCVGITFRHSRLGLGAMCHPMLPSLSKASTNRLRLEERTRFVDFAVRDLAQRFDTLGALRHEVEIKLFGGADVLPVSRSSSRATVGSLNCEAALRTLDEEGFRIAASRLRGNCGSKIQFNTETGEVLVWKLC